MSRSLEELAEKLTGEIEQHLVLAEALGELSYRERRPEIIGDHVLAALREAVAQRDAEWCVPTAADEKYGRDHGERITLGELVAKVLSGKTTGEVLDALDKEFLLGCWGYALKDKRDPNLLRDLRGFILEFALQSVSRERAALREWIARNWRTSNLSDVVAWLDSRDKP